MSEVEQKQKWITVKEAAKLLDLHITTVHRYAEEGLLSAVQIRPRGRKHVLLADVEKLLEVVK